MSLLGLSFTIVLQVLWSIAIVAGIVFGLIQLRHFREQRRIQNELQLVNSFQTTDFARGLMLSLELPEGLSKQELEARLGDRFVYLYLLMTTWESLGIMVHREDLPIEVVEDFFSGPIVGSWRNLHRYVEEYRAETRRETNFEWFQWLAEQVIAREQRAPVVPAHIEHADWSR